MAAWDKKIWNCQIFFVSLYSIKFLLLSKGFVMNSMKSLLLIGLVSLSLIGCTENYSNGERIGFVTKFSERGLIWKSWEGELNLTQTGMNTSSTFQFSIDNDNANEDHIKLLDSAATHGWKVKIRYHETAFKNWFRNRGETDYFVSNIEVLDRTPLDIFGGAKQDGTHVAGRVDTVYLVIWKDKQ